MNTHVRSSIFQTLLPYPTKITLKKIECTITKTTIDEFDLIQIYLKFLNLH